MGPETYTAYEMAIPHKLVTEVLELPDEDRAELVQVLLDSFDDNAAWDVSPEERTELDESFAEIDRGDVITADELLEQMRQIR